jgi:pimeloyl-ACP methyl ester carboxylesterase
MIATIKRRRYMKLLALIAVVLVATGCQSLQHTSSPPAAKTISVNGATLTYLQQGSGTPVVLLHGGFSDHRIWETQRDAVAAKYQFVAVSMRYFGTAPWPDNGVNFVQSTHVADVAAFIRELKTGPVYVVGRSYGATTALALAVQHPELVRALFLNEPGIPTAVTDPSAQKLVTEDRKGMAAVGEAVKAGNNPEATRQFFEWVNGLPGGFDSLSPTRQAMLLDNARTVPLQINPKVSTPLTCAQLGQIKVPVAITKGELTRPFYKVTTEAVSRCVHGAQLITIPGARHGSPDQNSIAFNAALMSFLARN